MAAKAWASQHKSVEEVFVQNDAISLCMLINRRARTVRVIDFRAGPSNAKRVFVQSFAKRESLRKVFTLVERDEVGTWTKLGFAREASIPAFYKRSDAFLLGCTVWDAPPLDLDDLASQSETRLVAAKPSAGTTMTVGQQLMERTIASAKKLKDAHAKDWHGKALPSAKVVAVDEAEARKAVTAALRSGRAISAFEPFGRGVERRYFSVAVRGGYELCASTESQACFANAYLELLQGPRGDGERVGATSALRALCDVLLADGVVGCFSLAPSDDVGLSFAFLHHGFRRTGLLSEHLLIGGLRKDAIVWSRKLANPSGD
jgi:hypothetical protein